MPRRPMTASERQAASVRMKRAWKTRRLRQAKANHVPPLEPASNGATSVEHRIILHAAGSDLLLSVEEARSLRDALSQALPTP
jgi:hypothetical protein